MDIQIKPGDKVLLRRNKDLLCQYGSYYSHGYMPNIRYGCNITMKSNFGCFVVIKKVCTEDSYFTIKDDWYCYRYDTDLIEKRR